MLLKELKELYEEKKKDRDDSIANGVLSEFLNGEFTMLEKIIYRMENKRKPLSDNSLSLTKEELEEFSNITGLNIILVELICESIYISYRTETGEEDNAYLTDVKAVLYLAERFDLTGEK